MTQTTAFPLDVACAEAIAFLYLLHPVPAEPSINPWQQQTHANPDAYSLPFNRERDLVNTLAFLSNISEDPNHVPALCIRETRKTDGVEVIIAVNQARHGDGLSILSEVKNGFGQIFQLLSKAPQNPDAEKAVFTAVVRMCSLRIRERIRYAPHKRKKSKQTLKQLLEETSTFLGSRFPKFRQEAKGVIKTVDLWLKHRTEERLCDLVEAVLELSRDKNLPQMLSSIPNTRMGPSERRNLLKMIRRVARYRDAARYLYRTAKKYPIARNMKIVLATLPQDAFRFRYVEHQPDFLATCARLQIAHGRQSDVKRVARLLGRDGQAAEASFANQCAKTWHEGKIHAEMQLIYYLETHRRELTPRAVASSKMACFLCNVFLCQAAKVYTKRCHGRLYPAWKLPAFPSSCGLERRFVQSLEVYIRNSAATLLLRQRRTLFPQPSESTLWTMNISATTLPMDVTEVAKPPSTPSQVEGDETKSEVDTFKDVEAIREYMMTPPLESLPTFETTHWEGRLLEPDAMMEESSRLDSSVCTTRPTTQATIGSELGRTPVEQAESSIDAAPCLDKLDLLTVCQGKMAMLTLGASTIAPVQAGPALIELEYTVGKNGGVGSKLRCNLEWLTREDAETAKCNKNIYIVDAESLTDGVTVPASNLGALYIATGSNLVRLEMRS